MPSIPAAKDPVVLSYAALRRVVGYVALALPFLVTLPVLLVQHTFEHSISAYYFTPTRNLFVGCLCAIATFMLCTRGYDRKDEAASFLSAVFALGVAFFPTSPEPNVPLCLFDSYHGTGGVHYTCATALFLTLAWMCLRLFTTTSPHGFTPEKRSRNKVYVACGVVILVSMAILAIRLAILDLLHLPTESFPTVMLFETTSLLAFGIAWLVKGEGIAFLNDKSAGPPHPTRTTDNLLGFANPPDRD